MSRDVKLIQRGVNVQANDLAVPPGTMLAAENVDLSRDGVAAMRLGYRQFYTGLPWYAVDGTDTYSLGVVRGAWALFNGNTAFHLNNGLIFTYDTLASEWQSVPMDLSHRYRFHGNEGWGSTGLQMARESSPMVRLPSLGFPFIYGAVTNSTAQAGDFLTPFIINGRFRTAFDVVNTSGNPYFSDDTNVRKGALVSPDQFSVFVGSATVSGYTDATGTAARFSGASWMATDGPNVYVADNTNAIRKIAVSTTVVTTLAGSITAGDADGAGAGARFRTISGMCYSSGFLYVTESAGHRVRKVDVSTGSVTIFAGSLTATSGHTNAVGTLARFNTPTGIEVLGDSLFVGDTGNHCVRRIVISSASVTDYAGSPTVGNTPGAVGGANQSALLPSVVVRSLYTASVTGNLASQSYLNLECNGDGSSVTLDLLLCTVPVSSGSILSYNSTRDRTYHYARCPASIADTNTGPNKVDCWSVNAYSAQDVRAADTANGAIFSTSERPRVLDVPSRLVATDPQPRLRQLGIDWPEAPSATTTTGSTFANNTTWAYRTLCGLKLPNGRLAIGPPSQRTVVSNTSGGTVSGSVTAFASPALPYEGLPFIQVYRTRTFSSSLDPGDDMYLCYEAGLLYATGTVFTDQLPDDLLGTALYTNNTQFQAAAASLPPPFYANEIAAFDQRAVLADYVEQPYVRVKCIGVSSLLVGTSTIALAMKPAGAIGADGSTLVVAATQYAVSMIAASVTNPSNNQFGVGSGGSAAVNAATTAKNIVTCINRCPDAWGFRAIYDENDPGSFIVYGQLVAQSKNLAIPLADGNNVRIGQTLEQSRVVFTTSQSGSSFATIEANASTRTRNTLRSSDQNDVDSFPVTSSVAVGAIQETVIRALPLAETLIVVKDKEIVRGDQSFTFQVYDAALRCDKPNSFAKLDNQWIGLFNRGFMALTSSQAIPIGRMIDRAVTGLVGSGCSIGTVTDFASGAAVDKQGLYICRFNQRTFAYNSFSKSWSTLSFLFQDQPSYWGKFGDSFMASLVSDPRPMMRQLEQAAWSTYLNTAPGYPVTFQDCEFYGSLAAGTLTLDMTLGPFATAPSATSLVGAVVDDSSPFTKRIESASGSNPYAVTFSADVASGSVSIFLPIKMRTLYAPSLEPGSNSAFTQVLVTTEYMRSGSLTARFYGRNDVGRGLPTSQPIIPPTGEYSSGQGAARTNLLAMPTGSTEGRDMVYESPQRFETPAERAVDQQLLVELLVQAALQPFAIKATTIDVNPTDNSKVRR